MSYQIIKRKGGHVLLSHGHQFYKHKAYTTGATVWFCSRRRKFKCVGSTTIKDDQIIKSVAHSPDCEPNHAGNDLAASIGSMQAEAGTSVESLPVVFKKHLKHMHDQGIHLVTELPSFTSVKGSLYSARKRKLQVNRTVFKELSEVEVPAPYKNFNVADYRYEDTRILVFCSEEA